MAVNITAEPGKQEVIITNVFDAPRELVFKAYSEPHLLRQWLGPKGYTMTSAESNATEGGIWRFVHRAPDGNEFTFKGVYHEATAPQRLVRTFEFLGAPGHVSLETATFEERGGRTTVIAKSVFQSFEDRDAQLAAGMKKGVTESHEQLAELLHKMRGAAAR